MVSRPWFVPLCLGVYTLMLCAATLSPASNFDGYLVWRFCTRILEGIPYDESVWDHRTARFGVVIPALLVQAVFGKSIWSYFVATSLATAAAAVATFLLGRKVSNQRVGSFAALAFVLTPVMVLFSDCQLTAEPFSVTFIGLCLWFGLRYCQSHQERDLWACAATFGACYLAKETNVFFGPGVVWLLYSQAPKRFKALSVFCGVNIGLFALETALYRLFTEQRLGRASVIMGNHLKNREAAVDEVLPSLWYLYRRYTELRLDMAIPLFIFAAIAVWFFVKSRRKSWMWVFVPAASFLLLTTFGVRSLNPVQVVQPFRDRYLLPVFGLAWVGIFAYLDATQFATRIEQRLLSKRQLLPLALGAFCVISIGGSHLALRKMGRLVTKSEATFRQRVVEAMNRRVPILAAAGDRKTLLYVQSFVWNSYNEPGWRVVKTADLRQYMLPTDAQGNEALETLRSFVGQEVLQTGYDYRYWAKWDALTEAESRVQPMLGADTAPVGD